MRIVYAKQSGINVVVILEDGSCFKIIGILSNYNSDFVCYTKTGMPQRLYFQDSSRVEKHVDLNNAKYL